MNLIQKMHALMVHADIIVWHYPNAKENQFEYVFKGHWHRFSTLEQMIEAAYKNIDPLLLPLPPTIKDVNGEY